MTDLDWQEKQNKIIKKIEKNNRDMEKISNENKELVAEVRRNARLWREAIEFEEYDPRVRAARIKCVQPHSTVPQPNFVPRKIPCHNHNSKKRNRNKSKRTSNREFCSRQHKAKYKMD